MIIYKKSDNFTFDFDPSNTIEDIKMKIQAKLNIPHYKQILYCDGKKLEDNKTCLYYNLIHNSIFVFKNL